MFCLKLVRLLPGCLNFSLLLLYLVWRLNTAIAAFYAMQKIIWIKGLMDAELGLDYCDPIALLIYNQLAIKLLAT